MRSRTKSKDKVGPLKDFVGNVIDDDKGMCGMLNDFFGSVFRLDALALSVIATATWLAGWVAGCHTPVLY